MGLLLSSAALLFGVSTGDPIADRIREAIQASNDGLSKYQIRRLFHGHVEGSRIDAALFVLVLSGHGLPRNFIGPAFSASMESP